MTETVSVDDFRALQEEVIVLDEDTEAKKLALRKKYARQGAERKKHEGLQKLAHDPSIVMVCSPITSLDDLSTIIIEERNSCMQIALRYADSDEDRAKDICQDAFFKAFQYLKKGDPYYASRKLVRRIQQDDDQKVDPTVHKVIVKNPAAWLHAVVRNTGLNECARRKKLNSILKKQKEDLERESYRFEQTETVALRNASNAELHDYVRCLPGHFAKIIDLHYFDAFSYEKIAEEMECPPSTIRGYAKRALSMLKDVYQEKRDVEGGSIGRPKKAG